MGVTFRSVIIGLILIPMNMLWVVLAEFGWYSGFPTCLSLFFNAVICLFLFVVVNRPLQRYCPKWAFQPGELLVIYTMVSIASGLAGHDFLQLLIPTMTHLHRYGPLTGQYGEIMPHVPEWLVVRDPTALQGVYEGQESIYNLYNYRPWLEPLSWWTGFVLALCAVMGGLNLILRKQWVEHEKLAYPILQIPLLLTTQTKAMLRNRVFWIGFGVAGGISLMNGLHVLFPVVPAIPIASVMDLRTFFPHRPWSDMGEVIVSYYPFAIGMFFFLPLDLSFSCWFFFLFFKAQRVLASHYGLTAVQGAPFLDDQMAGGFYAIALLALWMSRRHIRRMGELLLGRVEPSIPWERREARLAVLLIGGGALFLALFSWRTGMTSWVALSFFTMYFLISIAITRMRVELGPPVHDLHSNGPNVQLMNILGMRAMRERNPRDIVMFGMMNFFNRVYRGHPMPHGMEAFRIAHVLGMSNGRYFAAMGLACVMGTVASFWALLWMFYRYGGAAEMMAGEGFGWEIWNRVDGWFTAPEPYRIHRTVAIVAGLLFSLALASLRMNLAWWPLHPVAFALSGTWSMDRMWLCVFIAWCCKWILLRYGGAKAYAPAIPFFLGLIMGDFIVGGLWNLYGIVFETSVYRFFF